MIIRKLEALFTINTNAAQFKKATQQLDTLSNKVEGIMKAVAGYWAVQSLKNFVANTANSMNEIGKNAKFLGITADALQELRYGAEKSGLSIDGLEDALKELQIRAVDALSGSGEAFEAFDKLGIKTADASGMIKKPLDLLLEVADRLKELPTDAERIWVVDSMFGDEGSKMRMMLYDGAAGLMRLRHEARALGVVISTEGIDKASRFNQSLKLMQALGKGTGNIIVDSLLGPLTWLAEKIAGISYAFSQLEGRASIVRVALLTLSGIVTAIAIKAGIALAPFVTPFLPLIGAITLASIALEDLWGAFKGRDSLIGSVFKGITSLSTQASVALSQGFKDAFVSIHKEFAQFSDWITTGFARLVEKANNFIAGLVPDFFKGGFLAKTQRIFPMDNDTYGPHQKLNDRLAPKIPLGSRHYAHSQNVSVAVNVKSAAHPQEIGGAVSKAVRKELERERFNAFMGVMNYAG